MQDTELTFLASWQNFTMIIGTAAATLTGLTFIVITLMKDMERHAPTLSAGISAFNTPTVAHFCVVLMTALVLSAPWQSLMGLSLLLGLLGLVGILYLLTVIRHMRHVPGYQPPLRDWVWYIAVPLSAYIVLIVAAIKLLSNQTLALFFVSAAMAILLFAGIRNAWDLVTYVAVEQTRSKAKKNK